MATTDNPPTSGPSGADAIDAELDRAAAVLVSATTAARTEAVEAWNKVVAVYSEKINSLDAAARLDAQPFALWLRGRITQDCLRLVLRLVYGQHWDESVAPKRNEAAYRTRAAANLGLDSHWDLYLFFGPVAVASRACWLNIPRTDDAAGLFCRLVRVRGTGPNYLAQPFYPREFTAAKKTGELCFCCRCSYRSLACGPHADSPVYSSCRREQGRGSRQSFLQSRSLLCIAQLSATETPSTIETSSTTTRR
ncbi:hypothetical protein LY76DRAFT_377804 [Colletotrichum caudatum]|nr:hypothetical protein LY76DRAFT_377804 [Colletotrichum caudatum]